MYFRECEYCGANLDPGETCDCQKGKKIVAGVSVHRETDGQLVFDFEQAG